jgi:hypothetical protein
MMEVKYFEDVPEVFKSRIRKQYYDSADEGVSFEDWLKEQGFKVKDSKVMGDN